MTTFTLVSDSAGNRALYEDGTKVATWDRREKLSMARIEQQIALRAGTHEVEYDLVELTPIPDSLPEEEAPKEKKSAAAKPRAPKGADDDPKNPSPARTSDPAPGNA